MSSTRRLGPARSDSRGSCFRTIARAVAFMGFCLVMHGGKIEDYRLAYEEKKLYLSGTRYFWTKADPSLCP